MADQRTTVTELATGLGMLGDESVRATLDAEPREMVSVSPELWQSLRNLYDGGALAAEFHGAWNNGQAFLRSPDALRGRRPLTIEWKGASRAPGDEVVPADLRIDHVYFVSCKYLSRIVLNASPAYIFERALSGGHGHRGADWFRSIAEPELETLYQAVTAGLPDEYPSSALGLSREQGKTLATTLRGRWSAELKAPARDLAAAVAARSAERWAASLGSMAERERLLLRLLRIGSAPYFVLGADADHSLRLRIETPWDWKQRYRLIEFEVTPEPSDQPVVSWSAQVESQQSRATMVVSGHVEIRWAHGKFNGAPEAKVYLDTPHHRVPGYVTIA